MHSHWCHRQRMFGFHKHVLTTFQTRKLSSKVSLQAGVNDQSIRLFTKQQQASKGNSDTYKAPIRLTPAISQNITHDNTKSRPKQECNNRASLSVQVKPQILKPSDHQGLALWLYHHLRCHYPVWVLG